MLLFLYESGLIHKDKPVVRLELANLSAANLGEVFLSNASLIGADLGEVNLSDADLSRARLIEADLSGGKLFRAKLFGAVLIGANLSEAQGITNEQLEQQAYSLEGAIMPDGSRHP